jgi:hypothetical protein
VGLACDLKKALFAQSNRSSGRKQKPFRDRASKPAGTREEVLPMASYEASGISLVHGGEDVKCANQNQSFFGVGFRCRILLQNPAWCMISEI